MCKGSLDSYNRIDLSLIFEKGPNLINIKYQSGLLIDQEPGRD